MKPGSPEKKLKSRCFNDCIFVCGSMDFLCFLGLPHFSANNSNAGNPRMDDIPSDWRYCRTYSCGSESLQSPCRQSGKAAKRQSGKAARRVVDSFLGGFCLAFVCSLNIYDVSVYVLPSETIYYESEYQIAFDGPSAGRFSNCEAGIWIKDSNTYRRIKFCTSKSDLNEQIKQGMNAVWITTHTNNIGSYNSSYTFIFK